jgi:hypothetical protein
MRFDLLLHFGEDFAVAVESNPMGDFSAVHRNVSKLDLIFCVARKRQFFAASSLVPKMSPMARRRSPP